jgi:hypothetical protein
MRELLSRYGSRLAPLQNMEIPYNVGVVIKNKRDQLQIESNNPALVMALQKFLLEKGFTVTPVYVLPPDPESNPVYNFIVDPSRPIPKPVKKFTKELDKLIRAVGRVDRILHGLYGVYSSDHPCHYQARIDGSRFTMTSEDTDKLAVLQTQLQSCKVSCVMDHGSLVIPDVGELLGREPHQIMYLKFPFPDRSGEVGDGKRWVFDKLVVVMERLDLAELIKIDREIVWVGNIPVMETVNFRLPETATQEQLDKVADFLGMYIERTKEAFWIESKDYVLKMRTEGGEHVFSVDTEALETMALDSVHAVRTAWESTKTRKEQVNDSQKLLEALTVLLPAPDPTLKVEFREAAFYLKTENPDTLRFLRTRLLEEHGEEDEGKRVFMNIIQYGRGAFMTAEEGKFILRGWESPPSHKLTGSHLSRLASCNSLEVACR